MEWCSYEAEIVRLRYLLAAKTIENEQLKCALRDGSSALKPLSINTCGETMSLNNLTEMSEPGTTKQKDKTMYFDHWSLSAHDRNDSIVRGADKMVCSRLETGLNAPTHVTELDRVKSESGDETVTSMTENNRPDRSFPVDSLGIGTSIDTQAMVTPIATKEKTTEQKSSSCQEPEAEVTMKSIQEGISNLTASIRKLGVSSFSDPTN